MRRSHTHEPNARNLSELLQCKQPEPAAANNADPDVSLLNAHKMLELDG
jgi:hypothetical protein